MLKLNGAQLKAQTTAFIEDNGNTITLVKSTFGTPNPTTGVQPTVETQYQVSAIYEDDTSEAPVDGKYHIVSTQPVDMFSSIIKPDGRKVRIVDVEEVTTQDVVLMYTATVASDNDLKTE